MRAGERGEPSTGARGSDQPPSVAAPLAGPRRALSERALFLRSFLAHPRHVGAVLPTSQRTVRAMLDMASFVDARCVVEVGAGTGVYTREILARLRDDARMVAFELDPGMASALAAELDDPRLSIINDSAENLDAYIGAAGVDILVSAIPFTSLPSAARAGILESCRQALAPEGVMLVLQYSPFIQSELERTFASVRRRVSLPNLPPAFLFRCQRRAAEPVVASPQ